MLTSYFADCQESDTLDDLAWIIPVSVVGGILLTGLLVLAVGRCFLISKVWHRVFVVRYLLT